MNEIRRIGPARAVDTRGTAIRVAVPLNESPSPEWVHFFQDFPKEFTTIAHPKFVDIELNALYFTSEQARFAEWLHYIQRWIDDANAKYREYVEGLRRKQDEKARAERERQHLINDATEKLRGL